MSDPNDKEILDLTPEKPDEGKLRYTYTGGPGKNGDPAWELAKRVVGAVVGVAIFVALLFFFVYVIVPVVVIFLIYVFIRGLFRRA